MAAIELRRISKKYPRAQHRRFLVHSLFDWARTGSFPEDGVLWALQDIHLTIEPGQTFGIIGPNGAGKSTLLGIMLGTTPATSGEVIIRGKVGSLLELGAGFHPDLTGRENIYLYASLLGMTRAESVRRFDEIVEFSELEHFIDSQLRTYSSGMLARLGFSVAVSTDPDVLLVDEVIAVGDQHFQRKCFQRVTELRAKRKTIVLVSHALNTVVEMCDRVAWLHQGKIVQSGPAAEVVRNYQQSEVAGGSG